jgi:hypothetical protein
MNELRALPELRELWCPHDIALNLDPPTQASALCAPELADSVDQSASVGERNQFTASRFNHPSDENCQFAFPDPESLALPDKLYAGLKLRISCFNSVTGYPFVSFSQEVATIQNVCP